MALLSASRSGRALMSAMLALVIAIAAVPVVYTAAYGQQCSITLDICHPAQSANSTPAPMLAPPPLGLHHFRASSPAHQWIAAVETARENRPADAPDPPPPEPFA